MAMRQAPGLRRADLQSHDLASPAARRSRAGPRSGRLAPQAHEAGEALIVPAEAHAVRNVDGGNASELATYVVEKDKHFLVVVD
jgi:hypothetical protein